MKENSILNMLRFEVHVLVCMRANVFWQYCSHLTPNCQALATGLAVLITRTLYSPNVC